eukprot:gene24870-57461_t
MAARLDAIARHLTSRQGDGYTRPCCCFGSFEQNTICMRLGVQLLEEAAAAGERGRMRDPPAAAGRLDLSSHEWGFSEEYTEPPPRILERQAKSTYWFMISGAGLAPSLYIYGPAGQRQRARDEGQLYKDLKAFGKGRPPAGPQIAPWPKDVGLRDLPLSDVGVPVLTRMTNAQLVAFCDLLHR